MSDPTSDDRLAGALASLAPEVDMDTSRALFARERVRGHDRRWVLLSAAAAIIGLGIAGLVVFGQEESSPPVVPATEPSVAVDPSVVPEDPIVTTEVGPPASVEPVDLGTVNVGDVWVDGELERTVLWETTIGSGIGQLGVENCTECEPATPRTPLVLSDGRIVIADQANRRWVVVNGGEVTTAPFGESDGRPEVPLLDPIADAEDNIYALIPVWDDIGRRVSPEVRVYDPDDLATPVAVHGTGVEDSISEMWISADGLAVTWLEFGPGRVPVSEVQLINGLDVVAGQPQALPSVEWNPLGQVERSVIIGWQGTARTWKFPAGWGIEGDRNRQFEDGSVLVLAWTASDRYWVLLRPDGTAARWPADRLGAAIGGERFARDEVILLGRSDDGERFQVVRYRLLAGG